MQHRMDDKSLAEWEKSRGSIIERKELTMEDEKRAEFHCYRDTENGKCYIPSEQFRQSMIAAGSFVKAKMGNARRSMKNIVAAMFRIKEDKIYIPDLDEVDQRSAVNRKTKDRIIVIRPKWNNLTVTFTLIIAKEEITDEMIRDIIEHAGLYVGVGSYRPSNQGMFGMFEIKRYK